MRRYHPDLRLPARDLRRHMTDAERHLWQHLRRKQILGVPFYRQRPLGNFIVDFYAPAVSLVVEVDGSQHHTDDGRLRDAERSAFLVEQGLRVLRFDNQRVLTETAKVVAEIRLAVQKICGNHS